MSRSTRAGRATEIFTSTTSAGETCPDRFVRLQDEIEPLWLAVRPGGQAPQRLLQDWALGLAVRAALSAPGRSARQLQRRIKIWTGQTQRNIGVIAPVVALLAAARAGAPDTNGAIFAAERDCWAKPSAPNTKPIARARGGSYPFSIECRGSVASPRRIP
jgi:hypothetical protein